MTTTPTASPELPDLDKLEALARAATPGPWSYTGPEYGDRGGQFHNVESPAEEIVGEFGPSKENADFIAAADPDVVLALIAIARRAQPEGEAPQAAIKTWKERLFSRIPEARSWPTGVVHEYGAADKDAEIEELRAATLSPLCGAQHAESGKEDGPLSAKMHDVVVDLREYAGNPGYSHGDYADTMRQAANTIEALRAQFYHWGPAQPVPADTRQQYEEWVRKELNMPYHEKLGPRAAVSLTAWEGWRAALAAQQAAAPGALYSYMGESGRYELIGQAVGAGKCRLIDPLTVYRDTATGNLYFRHPSDFATRMVAIDGSAPGTPEAPQTVAARDVLSERQRQVSIEDWTPEHDDAHPCGEIAAFAALYAMPSAARDWPATETGYGDTFGAALCPEDWQPKFGDRRRELVKAGALVLAEIERMDRAAATKRGA
jgi:hypothetical protein